MLAQLKEEYSKKIISDFCPDCNEAYFITDPITGDLICANCGLILESNQIDLSAEWRIFNINNDQRKSHLGLPLTNTRIDKGLSTSIDKRDRDALGNKLSPTQSLEASKLRIWQIRSQSQSSSDRNLINAMRVLDRLTSQIGLQRMVKEHAAILYRHTIEKGKIQGQSIEGMVAAAIYIALRLLKCLIRWIYLRVILNLISGLLLAIIESY